MAGSDRVYGGRVKMQSLLRMVFPPQCISCGELVDQEFGLCGQCWKGTKFVSGLACDLCGCPLPGPVTDRAEFCDDCLTTARPWDRGRAAILYAETGRKLVLALKHGDRLDIVPTLAGWMGVAAKELIYNETVLVPVPVHPLRLLKRRFNQAAILSKSIAEQVERPCILDLLDRVRQTKTQDGMSKSERFANMDQAILPSKHAALKLAGRPVLLIDDVMTSGATLAAAADACHRIGARKVDVLVLARVAKDI